MCSSDQNCVVHAADESKVVVQGLDGYIVAEKNGQLLVCSLKDLDMNLLRDANLPVNL